MKIKAVQIANELGISKATVSLALNGKPGVNEETRKAVFDCKRRLEQIALTMDCMIKMEPMEKEQPLGKKGMILVIKAIKGYNIIYNAEMDLWTDVLAVMEREARIRGYMTSVIYVDMHSGSIEKIIDQCKIENIKGVILVATELCFDDITRFEKIEKPMVIYDNESPTYSHYCIVPDNYRGISSAVQYLMDNNYHDIVYLANNMNVYNFAVRRKAFCNKLLEYNVNPYTEDRMVHIGKNIEDIYTKSLKYLETHNLPQAFVMENYQVSIGMIRALNKLKIKVPQQVALIGVDVVQDYITYDFKLMTVKVPHIERASMAMFILEREIEDCCSMKSRILTACPLIEGNTVASSDNSL